MNILQYNHILNKPYAINENQTIGLEKILANFQYFQSARALYLKGLFNQNSYLYNAELKKTAAHTTDRSVLFDFITSDNFNAIQKQYYDDKIIAINNINVNEVEVLAFENSTNYLEKSILKSIETSSNNYNSKIAEKLEIGKPLEFSVNEKHSFQEWLQISRFKPIDRSENAKIEPIIDENNLVKKKKLDLIDKFIRSSPKIPQIDKNSVNVNNLIPSEDNNSYIMTETLAKVYLEQKKYDKAIQAYEILILKYPEKSSIFAIRIQDIKFLQHNNN